MWSSSINMSSNDNNGVTGFSSSSKSSLSSTSSSSPSPFSPSSLHPTIPRRKTMEEVWKDISLDHSTRELEDLSAGSNNSLRSMMLQDFLSRPFNKDPPSSVVSIDSPTIRGGSLFGASTPNPTIGLSLSSAQEFHYLEDNSDPLRPQLQLRNHTPPATTSSQVSFVNSSFDALASPSGFPAAVSKKRAPEINNISGDQRNKRMIKNRESAARSRARKQAYTNELELEVAQLMEENAKLRKQQQQQLYLATSAQLPKKNPLHRTSTAPF